MKEPHGNMAEPHANMNDFHIDIAGSRSEIYVRPGALPTVEGSTLRDDLFRRDFTINAMAICINSAPTANRFGELIDYYGGLRDLQQKEIRILHNLSFIDDPLRILRAMRFAGRYGFGLARSTYDAVMTALKEGALTTVSSERFSDELMLVLPEEEFVIIWRMLMDSGVLEKWFFESYPWRLAWDVQAEELRGWPPVKRWLAMLMDMDDGGVENVLRRLTLSRLWKKDMETYLSVRKMLRACSGTLEEVDVIMTGVVQWIGDILELDEEMKGLIMAYRQAVIRMDMGITGLELIKRGVPEGPYIGRLLRQIRGRWLEGRILNKEDENAYVEDLLFNFKEGG
jgi:tRNA nucleotidyltransferase (CCA-adding enzyme)